MTFENISICKQYCKNFSEGTKQGGAGILTGYGCQEPNYSAAVVCPVYAIKEVSASAYELFINEGEISPIKQDLIASAIPNPNEDGKALRSEQRAKLSRLPDDMA